MRTTVKLLTGLLLAFWLPAVAAAQSSDGAPVKLRLGPVGLSPSLTIANVGIDTNVFNTADQPTRDFTFSVRPATGELLSLGRLDLSGTTAVPLTYFAKAVDQRSLGFQQSGRAQLNLIHVAPYVELSYGSTYDRPNPEIDARVQQVVTSQNYGAVLRFGPRTSFDAGYGRGRTGFGKTTGIDADIATELDRRVTAFRGAFRMKLTPLTTFVLNSALEHDRFDQHSLLNNNSLSLVGGLELTRDARISGNFNLGVRAMRPVNPEIPQFTGVVGDGVLSFLAGPRTRLDGRFVRNFDYSIDPTTPYFVLTSARVTLTQLLVGHVDSMFGMGRSQMAYRDQLTSAGIAADGRVDRTTEFTAGGGYRFRIDARIGFNLSYDRRLSALDGRRYTGLRFGGTVNYGF